MRRMRALGIDRIQKGVFSCMIGNGNSVLELWAGGCVKTLFSLLFFFLAATPVKPS